MEIQTENNQPFKTTTRNLSFAETVVINLQLWYEKPCFYILQYGQSVYYIETLIIMRSSNI